MRTDDLANNNTHEGHGAAGDDHVPEGLANRRSFLLMGGGTVAVAAVLASCSRSKPKVVKTGSTPSTADVTTTTAPSSPEGDVVLLRTAQSIEALALKTYEKILAGGKVTDAGATEMIKLFEKHHQEHSDALTGQIQALGGEPYTDANEYLDQTVITAQLDAIEDQAGALKLVVEIENIAAQTYTLAGGEMTTPELREFVMSIGPSEARHMSVVYGLLKTPQVPLQVMPTREAASGKALVELGNATVKQTTTTTKAAQADASDEAGSSTTVAGAVETTSTTQG